MLFSQTLFKTIDYLEFADKFPENDLLWSTNASISGDMKMLAKAGAPARLAKQSSAYLVKFWVDLNYSLEEGIGSLYAVTNM